MDPQSIVLFKKLNKERQITAQEFLECTGKDMFTSDETIRQAVSQLRKDFLTYKNGIISLNANLEIEESDFIGLIERTQKIMEQQRLKVYFGMFAAGGFIAGLIIGAIVAYSTTTTQVVVPATTMNLIGDYIRTYCK